MIDGLKVVSVDGEHNLTKTNDDVIVFSNMYTKTNYLPSRIAAMFPFLERFYVASSRLKFISRKNFVGFKNLRVLDLRYNEIATIPDDAFLDLFSLEVLTISGNVIKTLPMNAFVSLMDLRFFDASDNEIGAFDDEILSQSSKLQEILLENNKIKRINSNFERFNDIGFVDLRDNVCIDALFLRDHPDYPLLFEFQIEVNSNCTSKDQRTPPVTDNNAPVMQWKICSQLELPLHVFCTMDKKLINRISKVTKTSN